MSHVASFTRDTTAVVVLLGCFVLSTREAAAQAGNTVDGAVWRFSLDRIGGGPGPGKLRGACRINDFEMFQRESDSFELPKNRTPSEWARKVGSVKRAKGLKGMKGRKGDPSPSVVWTITDIRAFDENRQAHRLDGTIRAQIDEKGRWSGTFIDGDGRHWDFSVQRIQE
ncbi:MAG: hypothetical protein ACOYK7_00895 [Pirellulales bacterium]